MNIFRSLLLVFLLIPVIEIYLFIQVGSLIGAGWTIFIIIGTAVLGAYLLRIQGISTFNRVQTTLNRGEIPAIEMVEGLILLIAGALLLTPGFFTDTVGFLLLAPPLRKNLVIWALKNVNIMQTHQQHYTYEGQYHRESDREHIVIEGEYKKEKDD